MAEFTTGDGTKIFFKDWGSGQPIVFSHGWPLSFDDWDAQMLSSCITATAVGIIFIGARFLLAPSTAAAGFGIAAWHDGGKADPYLSVKGVRDIASGLIAVILLAARMPHVLGWFELAASTIPIGDAIIVLRSNGPKATVYGVHGATAVVLLATAALLFT